MNQDTVFIEGLQVDALIGVYAHERENRQPLLIDLALAFDNRRAARSDAVGDTVDYAAVCAEVRDLVAAREPLLLESLAEALAARLMQAFGVAELRLRIRKPVAAKALGAAAVGVEIVRRAHTS